MTGFLSIHAFAEEPADAEVQESSDGPQAEEATPTASAVMASPAAAVVAPVPAVVAPAVAVVGPTARPRVGDVATSGYFRGGWGANLHQKGRMTCFAPSTISGELKSRYRLGNECEIWGEYRLATVVCAGEAGTVGTFGAQLVGSYQRDDKGTRESGALDEWYSTGGRVSFGVLEHLKVLGEAAYDQEIKSNGAPAFGLAKFTGAVATSGGRGSWARPELRLFYTHVRWSKDAVIGGIDSGRIYTDVYTDAVRQTGDIFGLQAEAIC